MNLPSFLWLWKIAAWSMSLSLLFYFILAFTGILMLIAKTNGKKNKTIPDWIWRIRNKRKLAGFHYLIGWCMASLVLLLLFIGIIGTLGHFGFLGQSSHLFAGLTVVALVLVSIGSALMIRKGYNWARKIHIGVNIVLFFGFVWVSLTGWGIVQKYLT